MATATAGDGTSIEWSEAGQGPAVVLVHGLTENATSWHPVAERLAADHHVITLDLRGHGRSAQSADYDLTTMADDVAVVVLAAGAAGAHLVGHSLGGVVVSMVGPDVPVTSVTSVDQSLHLTGFKEQVAPFEHHIRDPAAFPLVMAAVFEGLAGSLPAADKARLAALRRPDQGVVLGVWRLLLEEPPEVIAATIDSALAGCRVPHLSLFGTDPGPDYPAWLTARIPGATVEVWDDHGHYPHLVDPDRFVARLRRFWASPPRRPSAAGPVDRDR